MRNASGCTTCSPFPQTRHVIDASYDDECGLFRDYAKCSSCDGSPTHFQQGECVTICQEIDGIMQEIIYRVVAPEGTKDDPIKGTMANPRTWTATTMCQFMNEVLKALSALGEGTSCTEQFPNNGLMIGG